MMVSSSLKPYAACVIYGFTPCGRCLCQLQDLIEHEAHFIKYRIAGFAHGVGAG